MRVVVFLTAGRRVAEQVLEGECVDEAYEHALALMAQHLALARHQCVFVRAAEVHNGAQAFAFEVSPELPLAFAASSAHPLWPLVSEPPTPERHKAVLIGLTQALGFPHAGISPVQLPQRYYDRFARWLSDGASASMHFLARQADKRTSPQTVCPEAKSVLVVATPYSPRPPQSGSGARIARYSRGRDYHSVLSTKLSIVKRYAQRELGAVVYTSVDTGPVLERAYAEHAGLGWIGKNGMLIGKSHGSYVFLATLWTSLPLAPDTPHEEFCGSCTACIEGCPTGAIYESGLVDARRCLSYLTIEHEGERPADAPAAHGWLFGCDVCQEVCPWNRFAEEPRMEAFQAEPQWPSSAEQWLSLSEDAVETLIDATPLKRAGSTGLLRNARALLKIVS